PQPRSFEIAASRSSPQALPAEEARWESPAFAGPASRRPVRETARRAARRPAGAGREAPAALRPSGGPVMSPDSRRFRLDLAATGLLVIGLLVALSVFSTDPLDADAGGVYPPPETTGNLLGPPGAWLGRSLYEALGVAVYLLLASWFVLVVLC